MLRVIINNPRRIKKWKRNLKQFYKNWVISFPEILIEICNKMGIEVQETEQFPANVSGLIYKKDEKYTILVNAFHTIGEKVFYYCT